MSERTALFLVVLSAIVVLIGAVIGLTAMHADDEVVVFAYLLVLIGGPFASSLVVMHYGDKRPHR